VQQIVEQVQPSFAGDLGDGVAEVISTIRGLL
jgi:hypothetical protein